MKKKPGRPKLKTPTKPIIIRIDPEILKKLQAYALNCGFVKDSKPNVSAAVKDIIKNSFGDYTF